MTGMIEGFFFFGTFSVRKSLIYVGIFLRIQNNLKLSFCIILLMKQKIFLGVSSASWFFLGGAFIFVQGFFGFC